MDSKGLEVCSLERDKACWRGCCRDGRKRLPMTVLTVLPSICTHYGHQLSLLLQSRVRKLKQDLQNIWRPLHSCHVEGTILF